MCVWGFVCVCENSELLAAEPLYGDFVEVGSVGPRM